MLNCKWKGMLANGVIILFVSLLLLSCLATSSMAANLPTGKNDHGFVTNIQVTATKNDTQNIPGFSYDPEKTDYYFTLPKNSNFLNAVRIQLELDNSKIDLSNFGYRFAADGEFITTAKVTSISTANPVITIPATIRNKLVLGNTNTLSLYIGKTKQNGKNTELTEDVDIYNFKITSTPVLTEISVKDVEVTPQLSVKDAGIFNSDFYCESEEESIDLTLTYGEKGKLNIDCYIGDSPYTIGSDTETRIELNNFRAQGSSNALIPITLKCKDNPNVSRSYTLKYCAEWKQNRVTICNLPPKIIWQ